MVTADVWVAGRPAPFATAGEKPWRDAVVAAAIGATPAGSGRGMLLDFSLDPSLVHPGHPDVDNLCEPVFAATINRCGWIGGRRAGLGWFRAEKRTGRPTGARIQLLDSEPPNIADFIEEPSFSGIWAGPLPHHGRDSELAGWVAADGCRVPAGALALSLEFSEPTLNIGDISTGRVKNVIDCLYPLLGGTAGAPDDHRITRLLVAKGVAGLPVASVRITLGAA